MCSTRGHACPSVLQAFRPGSSQTSPQGLSSHLWALPRIFFSTLPSKLASNPLPYFGSKSPSFKLLEKVRPCRNPTAPCQPPARHVPHLGHSGLCVFSPHSRSALTDLRLESWLDPGSQSPNRALSDCISNRWCGLCFPQTLLVRILSNHILVLCAAHSLVMEEIKLSLNAPIQ